MGKWKIGALAAIGWLGAAAAAYAQPVPPYQGPLAGPSGPDSNVTFPAPPAPPPPPDAPAIGPGGDRGFDNAFDTPPPTIPPPCFHVDFEYLGAWTKHNDVPALVTRGSPFDRVPGALGQPNTTTLIGGEIDDDNFRSGGRVTLAYDYCDDRTWTLVASAFALQDFTTTVSAGGTASSAIGTPVIARPFFNVSTNAQSASVIAAPGVSSGAVLVQLPEQVYGADVNAAWNCWPAVSGSSAGSLLFGGRALSVDERLTVTESIQDLPRSPLAVASVFQNEQYSPHNYFYGAQAGAAYSWFLGPVTVDVVGKCAVGYEFEYLSLTGVTQTTTANGRVTTTNSALLVTASNSGSYRHYVVAVAPELLVDASYALNDHIRIGAGYDFLYLSKLLRPGDQIDAEVGGRAPVHPAVLLDQSSFWMQGFTASLQFSF